VSASDHVHRELEKLRDILDTCETLDNEHVDISTHLDDAVVLVADLLEGF
jgi:hypothetical protein